MAQNRATILEPLERRRLLSAVAIAPAAAPDMTAYPQASAFPAGHNAPVGFTPAQLKHAYGIDAINFAGGVTGDGSGQTVAIINAFDNPDLVDSSDPNFANSDLHKFDVQFGLPDPTFTKVDEIGGTAYPSAVANWANEAALDVEWVHATAPKAKIMLVEANSAQLGDLISSAVNFARRAAGVSVVTMSFAAVEQAGESFYDDTLSTPSGHAGVTFVAASGDGGAPGGYPAFSPNVVSVGATVLTLSSGNYGSEVGRTNSGGGVSSVESRPAYQSKVAPDSLMREMPDVSLDGEPNTGVAVYDSFNGGAAPWYEVGGTSLSAPVWAGLFAITNQGRAKAGMSSLDGPTQTLPRLYQINSADYHDITSGNNGFPAGAGFDMVTGLGTPKASLLVPDLGALASISGTVENGGTALSGVTVYVDVNNTGSYVSTDPHASTTSSGTFKITGMDSGKYALRQVVPSGFKQTSPSSGSSLSVTLTPGQTGAGFNFVDSPIGATGSISGNLFDDVGGDGARSTGDTNLANRTFYLDQNKDGKLDNSEVTAKTDSKGNFTFSNLAAGKTYRVRESLPGGWRVSFPSAWFYDVAISAGSKITGKNFADTQRIGIYGSVFNDANGDGKKSGAAEIGLAGWVIDLDQWVNNAWKLAAYKQTTAANGNYGFGTLLPGTYRIRVVPKSGYKQTAPSSTSYTVKLSAGGLALGKVFGEKKIA